MPPRQSPTRYIDQNLLNTYHPRITIQTVLETDIDDDLISTLFNNHPATPRTIGLASAYSASGNLTILAIAVRSTVLLIQLRSKEKSQSSTVIAAREIIQDQILAHPDCTVYAFDLAPLALSLHLDMGLRMLNGVDVQSACSGRNTRTPSNAIAYAVNMQSIETYPQNIDSAFEDLTWDPSKSSCAIFLALRAWIASYLPTIPDMEGKFQDVKRVNTKEMPEALLNYLAGLDRGDQRLNAQKANSTAHDFIVQNSKDAKVEVRSEKFQTRLRTKQGNIRAKVQNENGAEFYLHGQAGNINGKTASLKIAGINMENKSVIEITTTDKDGPTQAEQRKADTLLGQLQGEIQISDNPFVHSMIQTDEVVWPETFITSPHTPPVVTGPNQLLNDSQMEAIKQMLKLTNNSRLTLIQGPPGTGKTTVISAFVLSAISGGQRGIWLIAQSNVAVKNIAEKLLKTGFHNWYLLVAKDFQYEWHEHLYHTISHKVIQSDEYRTAYGKLQNCQVILCTLSTLSNPFINPFISKVPIHTLVIDEASQIKISDYVSPLMKFSKTIRKLCFIGDDKQLPPYGQEEIESIQSIFEISHLRPTALFLDTQYRMPPQIGEFISDAVYDGQLKSNPEHLHADKSIACIFVDVKYGQESQVPNSNSIQNIQEAEVVIKIATQLQNEEASYKIITPYEAQRNLIETLMKNGGLFWQAKCFSVDSFQGNEDDIIVISCVRSKALGFLQDLRRTNVMLTRCKEAMYICSSKAFLCEGPGADSLVGRMAANFGEEAWVYMEDIDQGNF